MRSQISPWCEGSDYYHEPFCGMAGVFLGLKTLGRLNVLNDLNPRTINLLRQLQNHPYKLVELIAKTRFRDKEDLRQCWEVARHPLMDARNYYFICRGSYSGGGSRWAGLSSSQQKLDSLNRDTGEHLIAIAKKLVHCTLTNMDAFLSLQTWDGADTTHYVDPPYHPDVRLAQDNRRPGLLTRNQYAFEFTAEQHERLLQVLNRLQGRVILSGLPHPLYDRYLKDWEVVELAANDCDRKERPETLWIKE